MLLTSAGCILASPSSCSSFLISFLLSSSSSWQLEASWFLMALTDIGRFLMGLVWVGGNFPFFLGILFCIIGLCFASLCLFVLILLCQGQADKNGQFHPDPVCTDPVQNVTMTKIQHPTCAEAQHEVFNRSSVWRDLGGWIFSCCSPKKKLQAIQAKVRHQLRVLGN